MYKRFTSRFGRLGALATVLGLVVFLLPPPAMAAGCPTTAVSEQGGSHRCYDAGNSGHVHTWTPSNFDAASAGMVIYVHGYNLRGGQQVTDSGEGSDGCVNLHYVDCVWDAHGLARQFSASGLNATFVAIEAPTNKNQGVKWTSLGSLLQSLQTNASVTPPNVITAIGHSAGVFTLTRFTGDGRMSHMVLLDTMYGEESKVKNWYNQGGNLKLTMVGGSSQNPESRTVGGQLGCTTVTGVPSAFSEDALNARCVYIDSKLGHMQTVTGGAVIPLVLSRSNASATPSTSPTTTPTTNPTPVITLDGPRLEIPIPNVTLGSVTGAGNISLPWIGQYVSGIYTFLISIIGVVAAIMMIIGGFQYLTSAGDKGRIGHARKRIFDALIGLVLTLGSYVILYTLNPELVQFNGLQLLTVQTATVNDEGKEDNLNQVVATDPSPIGSNTRPQALCTTKGACQTYCDLAKSDPSKLPGSTPGMASPSQVEVIRNTTGLSGNGRKTAPVTIALLKTAGELADAEGYKIVVSSAYRPLLEQIQLACNAFAQGRDGAVGDTIAWPGGSFHGVGFAVDVSLWKNGQQLTIVGNASAQQKEDVAEARKLAEIMLKAGFRRLNNEIWHFEPATAPAVGCRCTTLESCPMPPDVKC